jgi:hypothetical protein
MANIGTFTTTKNGFAGQINTLALNIKARFERVENPSDNGPQFRIFSGNCRTGRRLAEAGQGTPNATMSRSSWTTRASRHRSTPPWSRWKAKTECS